MDKNVAQPASISRTAGRFNKYLGSDAQHWPDGSAAENYENIQIKLGRFILPFLFTNMCKCVKIQ